MKSELEISNICVHLSSACIQGKLRKASQFGLEHTCAIIWEPKMGNTAHVSIFGFAKRIRLCMRSWPSRFLLGRADG
uniref:Uncharacterized protein n=1 Tax=Zea mays TaxID=4577 RepID=A0A804Q0Q0_MAIZE